jgi:N-acetylmuramoyl-L-alanine amidase
MTGPLFLSFGTRQQVANFDNSSVSLSIDLSSFPSTSNTSLVDYVYSTTGGAKDFNTPTEGGPVQNVQANLSVEAGVVECTQIPIFCFRMKL